MSVWGETKFVGDGGGSPHIVKPWNSPCVSHVPKIHRKTPQNKTFMFAIFLLNPDKLWLNAALNPLTMFVLSLTARELSLLIENSDLRSSWKLTKIC